MTDKTIDIIMVAGFIAITLTIVSFFCYGVVMDWRERRREAMTAPVRRWVLCFAHWCIAGVKHLEIRKCEGEHIPVVPEADYDAIAKTLAAARMSWDGCDEERQALARRVEELEARIELERTNYEEKH